MVPTDTDSKPHRCFVVIGFGVKTDLATGRAIDLDKTYAELIKPALDAAGVDGFRAIDINRTGTIDSIMYKWLIEAELVVADISTLNANVLYELGVRHALKPRTTILMAESQLLKTLPFDLSHTIIHSYQLDGEHLREEEKPRFRALLTRLLKAAIEDPPHLDSPVYDSLRGMEEPRWRSPEDLEAELTAAREEARKAREEPSDAGSWMGLPLVALIELAGLASGEKDFDKAVSLYRLALERNPKDPFLRQQLASALVQQADTQSNASDSLRTLRQAEEVLELSVPSSSTDPRILRVAGEINRRLHEKTHDEQYIEKAGWQFTRAFYIKQDHTHGIEGVKAFAKMAVEKKRPGRGHPAVHRVFMLCADLAAVCLTHNNRPGFTSRKTELSSRGTQVCQVFGSISKPMAFAGPPSLILCRIRPMSSRTTNSKAPWMTTANSQRPSWRWGRK